MPKTYQTINTDMSPTNCALNANGIPTKCKAVLHIYFSKYIARYCVYHI